MLLFRRFSVTGRGRGGAAAVQREKAMVRGPRWRWNLHGDWHGQGHCRDGQAVLGAGKRAGERGRAGDAAVAHDGHELFGHPVEGEGGGDAAG